MVFLIQSGDIPTGTEWMNNMNTNLRQNGRTLIRQLQDRDVDFSAEGGEFAEAFTAVSGRKSSVNIGNTTMEFIEDAYHALELDNTGTNSTTATNSAVVTPDNFFDEDPGTDATYVSGTASAGTIDVTLGRTFSSQYLNRVYLDFNHSVNSGNAGDNSKLQTYNGATWDDVETIYQNTIGSGGTSWSIDGYYTVNATCQGIRVKTEAVSSANHSLSGTFTSMNFYLDNPESVIELDIPSNTFSSTLSSVIVSPLLKENPTGGELLFKIKNGSDDSEWKNINTVSSFTVFSLEPTKVQLKGTLGKEAVYGFAVFE
jgi:hypothetical protein